MQTRDVAELLLLSVLWGAASVHACGGARVRTGAADRFVDRQTLAGAAVVLSGTALAPGLRPARVGSHGR